MNQDIIIGFFLGVFCCTLLLGAIASQEPEKSYSEEYRETSDVFVPNFVSENWSPRIHQSHEGVYWLEWVNQDSGAIYGTLLMGER